MRGSAGSQPESIVVCSVPQGAEHGRESVNLAKMKLCQVKSLTSAKNSRLRSHARCCVQASQVVQKNFMMVKKSSKPPACCILWRRTFSVDRPCKRNKEAAAAKRKTTTTTKNETAINSQFMHAKHTRI